jgi:hypothetical protein
MLISSKVWEMSRQYLIFAFLALSSAAGIYFYFSSERDWGPALDAVFNAQIESVSVSVYSPGDQLTDTIELHTDSAYRLEVNGRFIGPTSDDFILISGQNQLFNVRIFQGDQVVWTNNPIKIDPHGTQGFSFSRKFKLLQNLPPGSYTIACDYNRVGVATQEIRIVK